MKILVIHFSFYIYNFKLRSEAIINQKSLLVTELNNFVIAGLLYFHKGIWAISCGWISLSKAYVCLERYIFYIRENVWYIDTKNDDKESALLFLNKNSVFFYPWL